jgi:hypothetical protein
VFAARTMVQHGQRIRELAAAQMSSRLRLGRAAQPPPGPSDDAPAAELIYGVPTRAHSWEYVFNAAQRKEEAALVAPDLREAAAAAEAARAERAAAAAGGGAPADAEAQLPAHVRALRDAAVARAREGATLRDWRVRATDRRALARAAQAAAADADLDDARLAAALPAALVAKIKAVERGASRARGGGGGGGAGSRLLPPGPPPPPPAAPPPPQALRDIVFLPRARTRRTPSWPHAPLPARDTRSPQARR